MDSTLRDPPRETVVANLSRIPTRAVSVPMVVLAVLTVQLVQQDRLPMSVSVPLVVLAVLVGLSRGELWD
jgi:hypothetical protein